MKKLFLSFILVFLSLPVLSQNFTIRITPEAGFDAIDTIVNEFQQNQEQSILSVLNTYQPIDVDYVISIRPTGNLLQLMIDNPDWSTAQLARMLTISYAYPEDVIAVLANFENHPDIEVVSYDYALDPFNINPVEPASNDQITLELAYLPSWNCQTPATNIQNLDYYVSINNQIINLDVVVSPPGPPTTTICGLPTNPSLTPYNLGKLAQGTYTININHVFATENFPVSENQRLLVGNLPLIVRGSEPVQVPTLNFFGLFFIICFTFIASTLFVKQR